MRRIILAFLAALLLLPGAATASASGGDVLSAQSEALDLDGLEDAAGDWLPGVELEAGLSLDEGLRSIVDTGSGELFGVVRKAVRSGVLLLAVICGGLIGLEREYKRRPAGFRTHILICLGAAMTTLTSQFLYLNLHYYTDMARLGAQVVAGIGFIGAGAIIVTRRRRVKGLTTAAGLWAAAIVGLCLGGGFYEGGIFATILILAAEMFLSKLEYRMLDNAPEVNLYMEYSNKTCLDNVLRLFRDLNLKVLNMEITRSTETETHNACALFTLRLNKRCRVEQLIPKMNATEGVVSVEEL